MNWVSELSTSFNLWRCQYNSNVNINPCNENNKNNEDNQCKDKKIEKCNNIKNLNENKNSLKQPLLN